MRFDERGMFLVLNLFKEVFIEELVLEVKEVQGTVNQSDCGTEIFHYGFSVFVEFDQRLTCDQQ